MATKTKKSLLAIHHQNNAYIYRNYMNYWQSICEKRKGWFLSCIKGYPSKKFIVENIEYFRLMAEIEYYTARVMMGMEE